MRVRTLFAGIALATVTGLWSAPVALAADLPIQPKILSATTTDDDSGRGGSDDGASATGDAKVKTDSDDVDTAAQKAGDKINLDKSDLDKSDLDKSGLDSGDISKLPTGVVKTLTDAVTGGDKPELRRHTGAGTGDTPRTGDLGCLVDGVVNLGILRCRSGADSGNSHIDLGRECKRNHSSRGDNLRDVWFKYCEKRDRDHGCGCDSDHDRDWYRDCDRDHRRYDDRDRGRWYRDCDKHHRDRACGCDSDDDHDGDDDKDKKKHKKDKDDDKDTKGGKQTSVYPKGAPETGGGPVDDGNPFGMLALGLTGLLGTGLAGAGAVAERRAARR